MYDTPIFPEVFASFTTDISVETHIVSSYFTRRTHGTYYWLNIQFYVWLFYYLLLYIMYKIRQ